MQQQQQQQQHRQQSRSLGRFQVSASTAVASGLLPPSLSLVRHPQAAETLSEISGFGEFALAVTVTVACIAAMGPLCNMFGGALFNPVHNAAFVVAGKGSLGLNAARIVAQLLGALAGSYAAMNVTPQWLIQE
jgi:glycerol uptake facilitator-like aquaporin